APFSSLASPLPRLLRLQESEKRLQATCSSQKIHLANQLHNSKKFLEFIAIQLS
ncbi:unnamed protein product, partial [Musa hybrid cultivar]